MKIKKRNIPHWLIFIGIFRTLGVYQTFLHLPAFAIGIAYALNGKIPKSLIPGLLLGLFTIASCVANNVSAQNYMKAAMIIGGVGIAKIISKVSVEHFERIVSRPLLYAIICSIIIETIFMQSGIGDRNRDLSAFSSSLGGIELPRYTGFRGGSAFTSLILGVLGIICYTSNKKLSAAIYAFMIVLMVSRGPILALLVVLAYFAAPSQLIKRFIGWAVVSLLVLSPLLVYISTYTLDYHSKSELIELSTMRYYSFIAFLNFGLENPLFGIGYGNYYEYFKGYSITQEGSVFGYFPEHRLHEAHNLMLDVWGEVGIIGFLLLSAHIIIFWIKISNTKYAPAYVYMCVCMFFISGVSDWSIWVLAGLSLAVKKPNPKMLPL